MRISRVLANNRRKAFEVVAGRRTYILPYAKLEIRPSSTNKVTKAFVDKEIGHEGFTYLLESGEEGTIHVDAVLEYNRDPGYMRDLLLYQLTLEAQKRVEQSPLSRREIVRRLGTSATQFYRILDQTNYKKSVDQLLSLLGVLDCDVELVVKERAA